MRWTNAIPPFPAHSGLLGPTTTTTRATKCSYKCVQRFLDPVFRTHFERRKTRAELAQRNCANAFWPGSSLFDRKTSRRLDTSWRKKWTGTAKQSKRQPVFHAAVCGTRSRFPGGPGRRGLWVVGGSLQRPHAHSQGPRRYDRPPLLQGWTALLFGVYRATTVLRKLAGEPSHHWRNIESQSLLCPCEAHNARNTVITRSTVREGTHHLSTAPSRPMVTPLLIAIGFSDNGRLPARRTDGHRSSSSKRNRPAFKLLTTLRPSASASAVAPRSFAKETRAQQHNAHRQRQQEQFRQI